MNDIAAYPILTMKPDAVVSAACMGDFEPLEAFATAVAELRERAPARERSSGGLGRLQLSPCITAIYRRCRAPLTP